MLSGNNVIILASTILVLLPQKKKKNVNSKKFTRWNWTDGLNIFIHQRENIRSCEYNKACHVWVGSIILLLHKNYDWHHSGFIWHVHSSLCPVQIGFEIFNTLTHQIDLLKNMLLHCKNSMGYMVRMLQSGIHNILSWRLERLQNLGRTHLQTVVHSNSKGGDSFKKTS